MARVAEFRSVSLVHWGLTRLTRYISISMYIYSSKSALQIYQQFAWRIHATFGPLCLAPERICSHARMGNAKSCGGFFIGKIPSWRPTWCNMNPKKKDFPPDFHISPVSSPWGRWVSHLGIAPAPQSGKWRRQCLRLRFHGTAPESMEAGCSHSMEMDGNGMEKWLFFFMKKGWT